jgi:hypothetical protein
MRAMRVRDATKDPSSGSGLAWRAGNAQVAAFRPRLAAYTIPAPFLFLREAAP